MTWQKGLIASALAAVLALIGGPAWGHEEMSPTSIPTGRPNFVTLLAANEASSALNRLTLTAPDGVTFGDATRQPSGWTAEKSDKAITWTEGSLAPGAFDEWGVEVNALNQPGALRFRVASGFASGSTDNHTVEITAVAAGTAPTTAAPAATVTTGKTSDSTTATTAAAAGVPDDDGSSADSRANLALVLGALALALSLIALASALRSRGRPDGPEEAKTW